MRDFTLNVYLSLLQSLKEAGYVFQTIHDFMSRPADRVVLLRHDVDARKEHSLRFARLQHEKGIVGTYYFRIVPQSFDEAVIREIHTLGHEIGYHYEDMDLAGGDPVRAYALFQEHLEKLRSVAPVSTICMHGSPRSKYDNRDLWKHYDYRDFGLIGEPYFDLDFNQVFYLTDTGRRWDGHKVSVRDKVKSGFGLTFHTTGQIIDCIEKGRFPEKIMFTFHPQRWTDSPALWLWEKHVQGLKNQIKYWRVKYS